VVIDMATGAIRQELAEPTPAVGSMLPAGDKLVMPLLPAGRTDWSGNTGGRSRSASNGGPCKIVAYSWLGQGS